MQLVARGTTDLAIYEYIARTAGGEQVTGTMQADSEAAVVRTLDDRELFPVRVEQSADAARAARGGKVRIRDLSVFYGQLSDLLHAGVPLLRSLETLIRATSNARLVVKLRDLHDDVSEGKSLADSMADYPETFTPLHAAMVRAGEQAGFLEEVLANLGGFLERQDELRSKVRGAMIYPLVLMTIGSILMLAMLIFIVPRFEPFFAGISLPLPTVMLFAASDALTSHKWVLLSGLVLIVLAVRSVLRSQAGLRAWDRWRLKMPIIGKVICTVSVTRFCRIFGTMLANGVPILQALAISKDATGSRTLGECIETAAESVRAGDPLSDKLSESGLFPLEIIEMIAVAEESNQLEKVLVQVADTVDRRVNRQVDAAVRLIEPLILVVIAAMIGFAAVGLMYPIFTMSQTLK